jgi:hypothetical protein
LEVEITLQQGKWGRNLALQELSRVSPDGSMASLCGAFETACAGASGNIAENRSARASVWANLVNGVFLLFGAIPRKFPGIQYSDFERNLSSSCGLAQDDHPGGWVMELDESSVYLSGFLLCQEAWILAFGGGDLPKIPVVYVVPRLLHK